LNGFTLSAKVMPVPPEINSRARPGITKKEATMALEKYRKKRDFKKTPEPPGKAEKTGRNIFVVQKHRATGLHYDFRIEHKGILKSWAVPKGPPVKPGEKRLAVMTEDHPLDYADFEGVIPEGQYGGGKVIVWDRGVYVNISLEKGKAISLDEAVKRGKLEISLQGEKLKGRYALVKTAYRGRENWLLIKVKKDSVRLEKDLLKKRPESVISGRKLEELK